MPDMVEKEVPGTRAARSAIRPEIGLPRIPFSESRDLTQRTALMNPWVRCWPGVAPDQGARMFTDGPIDINIGLLSLMCTHRERTAVTG